MDPISARDGRDVRPQRPRLWLEPEVVIGFYSESTARMGPSARALGSPIPADVFHILFFFRSGRTIRRGDLFFESILTSIRWPTVGFRP